MREFCFEECVFSCANFEVVGWDVVGDCLVQFFF